MTISDRVFTLVSRVAVWADVKAAVEANHDENRWWPASVTDPRMRMLVAGWSTRVSYAMVGTYARVVAEADLLGFDQLAKAPEHDLRELIRPIGLPSARVTYLRSLARFLTELNREGTDPLAADADEMIRRFASEVEQASFKVAQCAMLYARGYHCGIIPVDSGMVTKLAPMLGIAVGSGGRAHERMRVLLQDCVTTRSGDYRRLAERFGYAVTIPGEAMPTWWTHLVLIYFKRLYLNRSGTGSWHAWP